MSTDTEEKKLLNKVAILVFFAYNKYSRSFIKLQLNLWCHMDYFNDVLTTFLGLKCGSCVAMQGQKAFGFNKKYLNLCYEDECRSYGFGTTRGRVINDRILILIYINSNLSLIYINSLNKQILEYKSDFLTHGEDLLGKRIWSLQNIFSLLVGKCYLFLEKTVCSWYS